MNLMTHMRAITSIVWEGSEVFLLQKRGTTRRLIIPKNNHPHGHHNQNHEKPRNALKTAATQHARLCRWHMGNSRRLRQGKTIHNAMQTSPQLDGTRWTLARLKYYSTKDSNKHQNQTHKHQTQQSIIKRMDSHHNTARLLQCPTNKKKHQIPGLVHRPQPQPMENSTHNWQERSQASKTAHAWKMHGNVG